MNKIILATLSVATSTVLMASGTQEVLPSAMGKTIISGSLIKENSNFNLNSTTTKILGENSNKNGAKLEIFVPTQTFSNNKGQWGLNLFYKNKGGSFNSKIEDSNNSRSITEKLDSNDLRLGIGLTTSFENIYFQAEGNVGYLSEDINSIAFTKKNESYYHGYTLGIYFKAVQNKDILIGFNVSNQQGSGTINFKNESIYKKEDSKIDINSFEIPISYKHNNIVYTLSFEKSTKEIESSSFKENSDSNQVSAGISYIF